MVISVENRTFFHPVYFPPRVFCASAERVPLELVIGARSQKLEWRSYRVEKEVWYR